jgi:hypothetical protein
MGFFMSQINHLMGSNGEPAMFRFGVVLVAIFVFAITILETGTQRVA